MLSKCRVICNVDTSRSLVLKLGPVRALLPPDASHDKISSFVNWILEDVRSLCSSSCDSRSVGTYLYHHFCATTLSTALELLCEYVIHPNMMSKARRLFVAISIAVCESSSLESAIPNTKDLCSVLFISLLLACDVKPEVRSASWNMLWKLSANRKYRNTTAFQSLEIRLDGHLGERDTRKVATLLSKETAISFQKISSTFLSEAFTFWPSMFQHNTKSSTNLQQWAIELVVPWFRQRNRQRRASIDTSSAPPVRRSTWEFAQHTARPTHTNPSNTPGTSKDNKTFLDTIIKHQDKKRTSDATLRCLSKTSSKKQTSRLDSIGPFRTL